MSLKSKKALVCTVTLLSISPLIYLGVKRLGNQCAKNNSGKINPNQDKILGPSNLTALQKKCLQNWKLICSNQL